MGGSSEPFEPPLPTPLMSIINSFYNHKMMYQEIVNKSREIPKTVISIHNLGSQRGTTCSLLVLENIIIHSLHSYLKASFCISITNILIKFKVILGKLLGKLYSAVIISI